MKRVSSLFALPLAATAMLAASTVMSPAPDVAAQATAVPKPAAPAAPAPAAKPAGAATAPRAGGIPLEMAGALVAGGSALLGGGVYTLRRRRKPA